MPKPLPTEFRDDVGAVGRDPGVRSGLLLHVVRIGASFAIVVVVCFIGLMLYARVPAGHWDRAEAVVDEFAVESLGAEVEFVSARESGSKWRFLFGDDRIYAEEYEVVGDVAIADACETLENLTVPDGARGVVFVDNLENDRRPNCSLSYWVSRDGDWIEFAIAYSRPVDGGLRLVVLGTRPHIEPSVHRLT